MPQDTTREATERRRGRPRVMESAEREDRVLDCAISLFSQRGPDDVTMADISRSVGMSKRTLYALYSSREELMAAGLERIVDGLFRPLDPDKCGGELEDRLRNLLTFDSRLGNQSVPLELLRVVIAEARNFPDVASRLSKKGPAQVSGLLCKELLLAAEAGEIAISPNEVPLAASLLVDMVVGNIIPRLLDPKSHFQSPNELASRRDLAIQIFLEGVRPREV